MDQREFVTLKGTLGSAEISRRLRLDPEFAAAWREDQAAKAKVAEPIEAVAAGVWRVSREGRDHRIVRVPAGVPFRARAVGELVVVNRHYRDGDYSLCMGKPHCRQCPGRRQRDGYFDAILLRRKPDQTCEPYRAIVGVPEKGVLGIEDLVDGPIRGRKFEFFRRNLKAPTLVSQLEGDSPIELPNPIDVRKVLMRLWNLAEWPAEEKEVSDADPNILKFRKQA